MAKTATKTVAKTEVAKTGGITRLTKNVNRLVSLDLSNNGEFPDLKGDFVVSLSPDGFLLRRKGTRRTLNLSFVDFVAVAKGDTVRKTPNNLKFLAGK